MDNHEHKRRDDDDQEQEKRLPSRISFSQLDQINSDQALATLLQQQESAFTMLETIMSDIEEEDEEEEDQEDEEEYQDEDETSQEDEDEDDDTITEDDEYEPGNFFRGLEYEAELEFLEEGEDSNSDQMEEDDIDPDELTYEDLVALGEIVGDESRGLTEEEISSSLCPYVCKSLECKTSIDRCVICQVEYEEEEQVVALHCKHPFHADCINKWLQIKKSCPICSTVATSFKQEEEK